MGIIKEQMDVDFVVESRPLTKEEETAISEFIRADKEQRKHPVITPRLRKKSVRKSKKLTHN
ncbi:MAG: hypothetical protein Q4G63_03790 [Bacteroidia bacterium]|nr:hypothetical protein [Bacteroidia bacterium]